jgi:hypothetical protein
MNNNLENICKEAAVDKSEVLSWDLPGGNEENYEKVSHDSWSPDRDLNPGPHKYEAGVSEDK